MPSFRTIMNRYDTIGILFQLTDKISEEDHPD